MQGLTRSSFQMNSRYCRLSLDSVTRFDMLGMYRLLLALQVPRSTQKATTRQLLEWVPELICRQGRCKRWQVVLAGNGEAQ